MRGFEWAIPLKYYRLFYRIKLYLEGFFWLFCIYKGNLLVVGFLKKMRLCYEYNIQGGLNDFS